jgi:hypothetical protein
VRPHFALTQTHATDPQARKRTCAAFALALRGLKRAIDRHQTGHGVGLGTCKLGSTVPVPHLAEEEGDTP